MCRTWVGREVGSAAGAGALGRGWPWDLSGRSLVESVKSGEGARPLRAGMGVADLALDTSDCFGLSSLWRKGRGLRAPPYFAVYLFGLELRLSWAEGLIS